MKQRIRRVLAPVIIAATIAAFGYYLHGHPATVHSLGRVPLSTLAVLLGLYVLFFVALALMTRASLKVYQKTMTVPENLLFNIYSSLINFFGPGQSGPVFRGAYLKKRHNITVKQYMFTTLLYYGFFAVISALFMCVGSRPWWQTTLVVVAAAVGSMLIIARYRRRAELGKSAGIHWPSVGWIFGATALQLGLQAVIYMVELHGVGAHASFGQVLAYTGVANFALFVSLTPGAIGIRESFLVFSQHLHHISSGSIVAANLLDRGTYLLLLVILGCIALGLHARERLGVGNLKEKQ
ncbi:MAG TPA: lysylphosphatidylglycerol synthase transmembrane domain-containing protein [Candidatus Saccharimonadales bacterium]|nr:lysylphosphatidylglycerol synthase transmembrane domain-containing protein [Candidatus Saccharimonadales bacterium]